MHDKNSKSGSGRPIWLRRENEIPDWRVLVFNLGTVLAAVGLIAFLGTFAVVGMTLMQVPFNTSSTYAMKHAVGMSGVGFFLMVTGNALRAIGARGLAGSGIVLDPARAREDLKPYARMVGGMIADAVKELDTESDDNKTSEKTDRVVLIRCRACGKLNEPDSKFCQECGAKL